MRFFLLTVVCGLLAAQQTIRPPDQVQTQAAPAQRPRSEPPQQPQQTPPETPEDTGLRIPVTVDYIVTPVLVYNHAGAYVAGIAPHEFHLYDNGKEQNINVDVSYPSMSLVILVQSNAGVEPLLPVVNRVGDLIGPQVIGDDGQAAVIAFDSRVRVLQEFTSDTDKIKQAFMKVQPGSSSSRMVDAVAEGVRLLRAQPRSRRRVMLLIGETRDLGSETRTREALVGLQMANIEFYSANMSRTVNTLLASPQPSRPMMQPPASRPLPPGVAATPNTVQQTYGINSSAQFVPLFVEIFRDVKAIFKANPVEFFTKGTGGSEHSFSSQRDLERALTDIGEQLHSQYMVAYSPNNRQESGFHEIRVEIAGHPEIEKIVTRPGYWLGPMAQ